MYFKRKAYDKLLEWKKLYSEKYAVLLEGARRVGKSTIAETFAKNEYRSYILIDFSKTTSNILECFDDIGNLNIFFLRLQAETGITLYEHESLIIFDEVQLFPKARQAIKHLVHDGRYSYLETGSLTSIKKNVKDILIPSEEMKLEVGAIYFYCIKNFYVAVPVSWSVVIVDYCLITVAPDFILCASAAVFSAKLRPAFLNMMGIYNAQKKVI